MNRMNQDHWELVTYIYNYSCREDELSLCALEMSSFFGVDSKSNILESTLKIDPSRSPFIKERIDVIYEGNQLQDIMDQVKDIPLLESTFKVIFVKNGDLEESEKVGFKERRTIEREIGLNIPGEADLLNPKQIFGIMIVNGRWVFGKHFKNEAIWLRHQKKPHSYSTALSTRVARSVANIAVPNPTGIKAIDPCCGIGTVLVEALSMGIDIVGRDINPLVTDGSRENIAHFGLSGDVKTGPISDVTTHYDVAIIDMPYNLCSVITPEEQFEMLQSARRFADKVVVITVDTIDHMIHEAGFSISDRCVARKSVFSRQVVVCE